MECIPPKSVYIVTLAIWRRSRTFNINLVMIHRSNWFDNEFNLHIYIKNLKVNYSNK